MLKDRSFKIIQSEKQKERIMKENEDSLMDLWDIIKQTNLHICKSQKEQRETKGQKSNLRK